MRSFMTDGTQAPLVLREPPHVGCYLRDPRRMCAMGARHARLGSQVGPPAFVLRSVKTRSRIFPSSAWHYMIGHIERIYAMNSTKTQKHGPVHTYWLYSDGGGMLGPFTKSEARAVVKQSPEICFHAR